MQIYEIKFVVILNDNPILTAALSLKQLNMKFQIESLSDLENRKESSKSKAESG